MATLRAWFDVAPDAMVAVDDAGTIVLANTQAERLFGYAPGGLAGLPIEALVPVSFRTGHQQHRRAYTARPRMRPMGTDYELQGARRDGQVFPVEIGLSPVDTGERALTIASIRDISKTRRALQAQERTRRDAFAVRIGRLALDSPDYQQAISGIPELVRSALDADAVVIFSTEWHRRNLQSRAVTGLHAAAADTLATVLSEGVALRHALATGELAAITREQLRAEEYAPIRSALADLGFRDVAMVPMFGRYEPLGLLAALSSSERGLDHDTINFLRSVANLLAAAVQRSRAEEQLAHAQRLEAIGQLTGGVAHDFNNLLTVVSGNLQLLEIELDGQPQTHELIGAAQRGVARGADLTRKLLAFARRQQLHPVSIPTAPLLNDLARILRRVLGGTISIEVDCPTDIADLYADPAELETALINLALNSRDAMPRGGRVTVAASEAVVEGGAELNAGRYIVLTVGDTGTGMPPDVQAHALEPFFTTKGAGKGSGLGLSMVHGFVKQSGGRMRIDSRLGYGTRIELWLPVSAAASGRATTPAPPRGGTSERTTVLAVEDEPEVLAIAVAFLRSLGYGVLSASNAKDALDLLATHPDIGLLFSDVVLGRGMNGIALAAEVRRSHPALPVLLTSGYPHSSKEQPDDIGNFALLRKPYRREELGEAIGRVLSDA
jgi:PAS domain S-box-containing protein